ncbi:MAG: hypothetical protein JNL90_15645 [Planctomycetes bacterium]|nr:hypothetical protein [Planctomycetota bacterium]
MRCGAGARTAVRLVALAVAGIAAGCANVQERDATDPLLKALDFVELTERRGAIALPPSHHRPEVDYKSELRVTPDPVAIGALLADTTAGTGMTPAEQARLEVLEAVPSAVANARALADEAAVALTKALEAKERGTLDETTIETTQQLLRREADQRLALMELVAGLARAEALEKEPGLAGEALELRVGDALAEAVPKDARLDLAWIETRVRAELERLAAQYEARRAKLEAERAAGKSEWGLRVRALLHSGEEQSLLPVENYDDSGESYSGKPPRLSFGSPAERAQLKRELEAIDALLDLAGGDPGAKLELKERWDALRDRLVDARDALLATFALPAGGAGFESFTALLEKAIAESTDPRQAKLKALQQQVGAIEALVAQMRELAALGRDRSIADWFGVRKEIGALAQSARKLVEAPARAALVDGVAALGEFAVEALKGKVATIEDEVGKTKESFLAELEKLRADLAPLHGLVTLIEERLTPEVVRRATQGIEAPARPRALDDLAPATVKLDRSLADRGHEVDVVAELVRKVGEGPEDYEVKRRATRTFVVDRFGLVSDLSADVAFISQRGTDHFRTAPSAAWTMHWRRRDTLDDSGWVDAWQLFDPGVGLSVVAISTDDESFQPGVGAHLSLFHDIVKVGGGVNLGADDDRDYWFVGIGLFEAIDGIGNLFGLRDKGGSGDS